MRNLPKYLFAASFLFMTAAGFAADEEAPSIKTGLSRKRIFIGDRIRYKVEIVSRRDIEIELPKFADLKIGDCEIKDSGSLVKKSFFGRRYYTYWFDITSYYVGRRSIPQIEIRYRQKGGDWKTLKSDELFFTVESVLPKSSKLTDIKDIKDVLYPFSFIKLILWMLGAAAGLWLLIKLLIKLIFKKAPPKLPHEAALEEIEAAAKQLGAGGNVKEYYVRISDAVRRYIEQVFALKAPEMTTQEFLMSLGDSPKLTPAHKNLLMVFMEACDLVKFAKYTPVRSDIESVFSTAKKFIEDTKEVYMKKAEA